MFDVVLYSVGLCGVEVGYLAAALILSSYLEGVALRLKVRDGGGRDVVRHSHPCVKDTLPYRTFVRGGGGKDVGDIGVMKIDFVYFL